MKNGRIVGLSDRSATSRESNLCAKSSDSEDNLPSDIEVAAQSAIDSLIPGKSKELYEKAYKDFDEWMEVKKIGDVSEHFAEQAEKLKPSSLCSQYSMLRTLVLITKNIDITEYHQVVAFFSEIRRLPTQKMNDKDFLFLKVVLIVGVFGTCRREETTNLTIRDVRAEKNLSRSPYRIQELKLCGICYNERKFSGNDMLLGHRGWKSDSMADMLKHLSK
ncbi:hypothetical protein Zmor_001646 [Zophobas morio]|uniref:Uncharacterized protein n=1 Tax=Zophobas morio TaxID=2755281 RepID=A0AA38IZG9_9CUCU|nr:hypothetical protein Zmor_001646 [Zophobas morio]